jgi:outer membrane protein OmpA-like peptidoglycan-associated protein
MKKCILMIGVTALSVWTAAGADVPKVGVYLGYDYVRFNSATNVPAFSANGGGGQFIYNFNGWVSGVADLGAVHNGNISGYHLDSTIANFLFGPRLSIRRSHIVTPYFQVLWGGVYAATSTQFIGIPVQSPTLVGVTTPIPGQPITVRPVASQTAFAMTAGGGLDIKISRHVLFRPIGVDYYLTRLQNLRTAGDNNQNNIRYSAGFTFLIGGEKPTPPPPPPAPPRTRNCPDGSTVNFDAACPKLDITLGVSATSRELCQGDATQVVASAGAANQLQYAWSVNGQEIGKGPTFEFGTAGREPGTYKIRVMANGDNFNPADAETTITVREYLPPTGSAAANPAQINGGETSALSASFQGQCGGAIQAPTFEASEGSVRGNQFDSAGVKFDPAINAEQHRTVTITAKAADNRSVGTATTTIEVIRPALVAPIRLPDVLFAANNARVNNCGKRILLEQLRAYSQRDPSGTVVLVGHNSSDETAANLAEQRALNSAAVITAGTGVCLAIPLSQVQVSAPGVDQNGVAFESGFCQASVGGGTSNTVDMRRVEVWFVPTGGQLPASVSKSQSASSLPVSSLGCPK